MATNAHENQPATTAVSAPGQQPEYVRPTARRRPPLFLLGVALFLLGPILYIVLFNQGHLATPWYVPILATAGVLFMILSVRQRGGILRGTGLVLFGLLCAGQWFIFVVATKTPAYTGPVQVGGSLPAFTANLADGKTFANQDLAGGASTVLVFFRGRW
ncbi:MAG TPA: hypothetical protein VG099_24950 [Gemmataceae bacterium]|jgi:peptidoglycan/LPS O-acetylase OafA/YrhL|nr:hypothetical protein [Gemmataceae bacterium]